MTAELITRSTYPPVNISDDISIPQFFTRYNPDNVKKSKVVHVDLIKEKELTYGGLRESAGRASWGLKKRVGLRAGDVVCVLVQNSSDFVILAHAIWWTGAIISPVNPLLTVKDILHCFTLVQPTHIAVSGAYHAKVQEALKQYRNDNRTKLFSVLDRIKGILKFPEDIQGCSSQESVPPYDLEGQSSKKVVASILFSSGTTGPMKGVKVLHYNHIINLMQGRASVPLRQNADQRVIFFAPYCHIYGLGIVVLNNMWLGNFTCALPNFDLEIYCQQFSRYKATLAYLVPPIVLMLVASDIPKRYDFSALECMIIGAAPLKKALQERIKTVFPQTKITQGYGLSECSPSVMMQHEADEEYVGTCGRLFSTTEARLVDPVSGKDVGIGQEGELWVRGPQTMMGYMGDEAATRNTFAGEWLRTGDVMICDENENFWVTDRLKEMIKYKGLQIAPSELEDQLVQHPSVIDAAVCAIYSPSQASEVPLAYVSLAAPYHSWSKEKIDKILEEVRAWIDSRVAGYKKLRGGVFHLQTLPKNPSGKILRRELPARKKGGRVGVL
ncbi:putative amp dependent CoA ligase [Pleomassaria siparia CBS 279.74]|uniref:Putative amp dependent CoA ligase n=1 Tax=Pleomassaria siparia CBS 279.74 TaxID=1314801 RepID=A0A6G1JUN1_9PLEO|nr:putative amp dependent CoA ligase [Pleomassaria siparia CBS 279.74]